MNPAADSYAVYYLECKQYSWVYFTAWCPHSLIYGCIYPFCFARDCIARLHWVSYVTTPKSADSSLSNHSSHDWSLNMLACLCGTSFLKCFGFFFGQNTKMHSLYSLWNGALQDNLIWIILLALLGCSIKYSLSQCNNVAFHRWFCSAVVSCLGYRFFSYLLLSLLVCFPPCSK